ncbi:MAG: DUF3078 domain-containing protein [Cytophagaceae bacterium]|nr:DUF3078 domain-containing protein [Cytophagaceae bacterium]
MKKFFSLLFLLPVCLLAQEAPALKDTSYWKSGSSFNLNISQAGYSNWASGGINSIAWTMLNNSFLDYKKDKVSWSNSLELAYGMTRLGKFSDPKNKFRKTDDKISFISKFSYGLKNTKFSALLDFRSQIANGFNYPFPTDSAKTFTSRFLAPAYIVLGTGIEYAPNANFYVFYSPVAVKGTIVDYQPFADAGQFGVRAAYFDSVANKLVEGKNSRFEFGSYLNAKYKKDLTSNITFTTALTLFEAYFREELKDGKYVNVFNGNVDVFWDATLLMKVNKYITASIATTMIYDDDVKLLRRKDEDKPAGERILGPAIQFREVISVGFAANIRSKNAK